MKHLTSRIDIERTIADNCLCLFYIKSPDCGVCNVMLDKVARLADQFPVLADYDGIGPKGTKFVFYI